MSGPLHSALADLLLAYSQQHRDHWSQDDIALVQRCQAALAQADALERGQQEERDRIEARQEAEREGRGGRGREF